MDGVRRDLRWGAVGRFQKPTLSIGGRCWMNLSMSSQPADCSNIRARRFHMSGSIERALRASVIPSLSRPLV